MPLFKKCCETCRETGCYPGALLPIGDKAIAFSATGYNPLSESTTGTFGRNTFVGTCCTFADVPMTASYASPVNAGSIVFSDSGVFPIYVCCSGTEVRTGQTTHKVQLVEAHVFRFRLRLCKLQITVCQKTSGYGCGLEIKVKAIFGRKLNGDTFQACQSRKRIQQDGFWICESGVPVKVAGSPTIDTTEFRNDCCCTGVGCGGSATDFVASPPELSTTLPDPFDCAYTLGFGGEYGSSDGAQYFHIQRTVFLLGVTTIPTTPITFLPSGQTLVGAPPAWIIQPSGYESAATSSPSGATNSCGRTDCTSNYGMATTGGYFLFNSQCGPQSNACIEDRVRIVNQVASPAVGTHYFDPMSDPWDVTIT